MAMASPCMILAVLPSCSRKKADKSLAQRCVQMHLLAVSSDGRLAMWHLATPDPVRTVLNAHAVSTLCLVCHSSGLVATGGADKFVRLWQPDTGKCLAEHMLHSGPVSCMAFSPDGNTLVSVGIDGELFTWAMHVS
jgi:WD40 repeat protein